MPGTITRNLTAALTLMLALWLAGCATTVPVSVVVPARFPDASLLRTVYVDDFQGRGGIAVRDALETYLSRHTVDGIQGRGGTGVRDPLETNLSRHTLDGGPFFTTVRDHRRADGLYGGRMIDARRNEEHYLSTQSVCVRSGDDPCASRVNREVTCTRYWIDLAAQVELVDARSGWVVYSRDHRSRAQDSWCPGQERGRSYDQLEYEAAQGIAGAV